MCIYAHTHTHIHTYIHTYIHTHKHTKVNITQHGLLMGVVSTYRGVSRTSTSAEQGQVAQSWVVSAQHLGGDAALGLAVQVQVQVAQTGVAGESPLLAGGGGAAQQGGVIRKGEDGVQDLHRDGAHVHEDGAGLNCQLGFSCL